MVYRGNKLKEISFPLGGIGTGSIGLTGNGAFVDWEIFNRPNKGSTLGYSSFVVKAEMPNGEVVMKVLHGDHLKDLMGKYSKTTHKGFGYGPSTETMAGFPHFKNVTFNGKFPIATLTFKDTDFPAEVTLQAFNPFIPLDSDNSSIPAAFFNIKIKSLCDNVKFSVFLSVANPFEKSTNKKVEKSKYTAVQMFNANATPADKDYGDLTVATDSKNSCYQEYWYRGDWQDKITTFWHDATCGDIKNRSYNTVSKFDTCTVGAFSTVNKGNSDNFKFIISWNIPNCYNYWQEKKDENGNDILWKNYYSTLFSDSAVSAFYCLKNWKKLYSKTAKFCNILHSSTLDKWVLDAVSSTVSVLKSPTVFRLENGAFYGFEGVHENEGSCEGTCTHVWSYAYALCFLFPELERSIRDTEFKYSTDQNGKMFFRTSLPLGSPLIDFHPCIDGQMATVIKIYRDWKITGNSAWLKENWENIKKILEYAWHKENSHEWDRDKDGVLEGRQHHTLDVELFGPSAWLQGMYLAALKAGAEMASFLGDAEKTDEYTKIFENGYKWTKENLFNGEYFFHQVDLSNKEYIDHFDCQNYWNEEAGELKYQIGEGSIIDQLLGQWHANISGLGDIFDKEQRKTALQSMFKNNFKPTLRNVTNMWRNFAINDEGGAIICDYPEGTNKPIIPIPYCEECMTGFEYAFAGLLISEGFTQEGLAVVHAIRERYNGEKRNPFNEIECGSNYARAMASFALLPIFSGFEFDMPKNHIGFSPVVLGDFKCFYSVGSGWGQFIKTQNSQQILVLDGFLQLKSVKLGDIGKVKSVLIDGKETDFHQIGNMIEFKSQKIKREIKFIL